MLYSTRHCSIGTFASKSVSKISPFKSLGRTCRSGCDSALHPYRRRGFPSGHAPAHRQLALYKIERIGPMSGTTIQHKSNRTKETIMNPATQNKSGHQVKATSSFASGERGIRTPGAGFPAHGISSAAAVGSTTLGQCDKTTYFIGFFASFRQSDFCQNRICQKPVKIRSADRAADVRHFCQNANLKIVLAT